MSHGIAAFLLGTLGLSGIASLWMAVALPHRIDFTTSHDQETEHAR